MTASPRARRQRSRSCLLALSVLLLPSILAGVATAQGEPPEFRLLGVSRAGDQVTFTLEASTPHWQVTASLREGEKVLGLPDQRVEWLEPLVRNVTFTLQAEASAGTLHLWWRDVEWESQRMGVPIPPTADPAADASGNEPRLVVAHAAWDAEGLGITVENVGSGPARDVLVSLEDQNGRKIARPFYRTIPEVPAGVSRVVHFEADASWTHVTVMVEHGDEVQRTPVTVTREASSVQHGTGAPNVTLVADLPFREAEVGRTVDYALRVKNTGRVALVDLRAVGLPEGYSARFFVGGSAVPSLFVDMNQSRPVTMSVTIPNAESEVDRTVDFRVEARVNGTAVAEVPMGLAVRGVGRLEVSGGLDVSEIPPGGAGTRVVSVKNTGSAPLFDVQLDVRRPYGWTFSFEPRRLDRLDPGEEQPVTVTVRAPEVVGPGRYPADLTAKSGDTASRAFTVSMQVPEAEASSDWSWLVSLTLIGGILGGAAWWKRRGIGP